MVFRNDRILLVREVADGGVRRLFEHRHPEACGSRLR
jgi:hypothetical protein